MTTVNGSGITYDGAGNPTEYHDGTEFMWDGRELTYVGKTNGNQYTYFYNADGIRDTKQVFEGSTFVTHNYRLMGDKVVEDKWGVNQRLVFMYDENGAPNTVYYYNGSTSATKYYYVLNLQGDVTEIRSTSNALVAQYNYDAFGNILSIKDANGNNITSSTHIANVNPLRYRGYFYDTETGFYYLNSRYYDPATRRFISADDADILAVGQEELMNYNLYSYCFNNPVMYTDGNGEFPFFAITAAIGAVAGAVVGGIVAASNGDNVWAGIGIGAAAGGLIGLGAGAAAGTLLAGSATASTTAVIAGGKTALGIGAATTVATAQKWDTAVFRNVQKLTEHFNEHAIEWGNKFKDASQYLQGARNLLNKPVGRNILEFTSKQGWLFKYNKLTNEFVLVSDRGTISTFFKPVEGIQYWYEQVRKYGG